jgi:hypothetical protein
MGCRREPRRVVVGIVARPSACKDVAGLGQWLHEAVADVDADTVISLLTAMPRTTAQRAAYLRGAAGNDVARGDRRRLSGGRDGLARSARRRSGRLQRRDPGQRHPPSTSTSACAPDHDPGHGGTSRAPLSRHEGRTRLPLRSNPYRIPNYQLLDAVPCIRRFRWFP